MSSLKSFKQFLAEVRRNPKQNQKVSAYDALLPYSDDPSIYISFTADLSHPDSNNRNRAHRKVPHKKGSERGGVSIHSAKIGINPNSKFNTPLGIYCYPLARAWEMYGIDRTRTLTGLPFAASNPHIWVLRAKDTGGFVEDMYTDYGSSDYDRDIIKLKKIWIELCSKSFTGKAYQENKKAIEDAIETYKNKESKTNDEYMDAERKLDYWETELAALEKSTVENLSDGYWDDMVDNALSTAKEKNPIMSFWNLSRIMAEELSQDIYSIKMSTMWNTILRKCGYTGFADISSKGYIHPSEPMQAVFLSTSAFTVMDKVLNRDYATGMESIEDINRYIGNSPNKCFDMLSLLSMEKEYKPNGQLQFASSIQNIISYAEFEDAKTFGIKVIKSLGENNNKNLYDVVARQIRIFYKNYMSMNELAASERAHINQILFRIRTLEPLD